MQAVVNVIGSIAAIAGILVCGLSVIGRLDGGDPRVLGIQASALYIGGIGLMVFYIVTKLACPKQ